jgi:acyl transferase domain-containing protein
MCSFDRAASLLQGRLEGVKQLVISTQQDVAMKRAAAIREIQSAARALLKALKLERKARHKGNTSSKIGRQLDLAMGDDMLHNNNNTQNNMLITSAATSLDVAMESFEALQRSSAGGSSAYAYDALLQQRQRQQQQQWQQQEEWVQDWARLLEKARSTLRESLASSSSSIGVAGGSLEEDYEAEVEAELQVGMVI